MAAQRLIAEKLTVDVGKTGYEQPVTAVFNFRNKSSRKLRIVSVRPDCNCTVVDYPKGDIADKFQVKMTWCHKAHRHQCLRQAGVHPYAWLGAGRLSGHEWYLSRGHG